MMSAQNSLMKLYSFHFISLFVCLFACNLPFLLHGFSGPSEHLEEKAFERVERVLERVLSILLSKGKLPRNKGPLNVLIYLHKG